MPIQLDNSRPIRTVDSSGNTLSTQLNDAPPMKQIDVQGNPIEGVSVDAHPDSPESKQIAKIEGQEPEAPINHATEARKLFLSAQKADRRAQQAEKKAKESLARAEAFDKARSLAESGEDPTALLAAAGLDPVKYYRDMTTYALSDKHKAEDPRDKEIREMKESLDKYRQDLEQQANSIKEKEDTAAHNAVITSTVIPLLNNNPEKYETLLLEYGKDAAVQVYKTVFDIYQKTGKARSFEEVADELENYWADKVESGLNSASKLRRFSSRFSNGAEPSRHLSGNQSETPARSPTLSNRTQSQSSPPAKPVINRKLSRQEQIDEILKRHG